MSTPSPDHAGVDEPLFDIAPLVVPRKRRDLPGRLSPVATASRVVDKHLKHRGVDVPYWVIENACRELRAIGLLVQPHEWLHGPRTDPGLPEWSPLPLRHP